MKTKFSDWISQRVSSATRRGWLGLLLCGALELVAAVWIPAHWETVTGTGWVPSWVDGRYDTQWVDGYWENQTIDGYWEDAWIDGHMESVWVDGYWDVSWTDGYWAENWVDGYWEEQWHDGYWAENWVDGYWDEDWNWNDGYWDWWWVDGYSDWNWVDGYSEWNWLDGFEDWSWVDGSWGEQWVDGYWDQNWVPPSEQTVWVDGYNVDVWVDGYWTIVWGNWSVDIWVEGHWEGEWTWTPHEVLGDWTWSAWSPEANTVLQGTTFTQARSGVRSRVTWETNEAGDMRNYSSGPDYTTGTQQATGTKPFTWTAFDEPGEWNYPAWSPDPAGVACGQTFTQTRTPHRENRVGERNELGDERYVTTNTEDGQAETQQATGTQGCGGGGPTTYSLTVVNGTGSATGLSPGAARTITAVIPHGALFTGWEISGPGTIPVSRLGVTRILTMGAGNVTATATYQIPGTGPIWFDVNDDGIRDEVAPRGALGFNYAIDEIWTTYEYESANWDIFFDWRDLWWPGGFSTDNFPNLWLNYRPAVITSATTWIGSSAVFNGEADEQYRIMGWNSSGFWGDYGSVALGSGDNLYLTMYLPSLHAEDFLAFQFVRARISKPPSAARISTASGNVLVNSSPINVETAVLMPANGQLVLTALDTAGKVISSGAEVAWRVVDEVGNLIQDWIPGVSLVLGDSDHSTLWVYLRVGAVVAAAPVKIKKVNIELEPITTDGGIPPLNATGFAMGEQRSFKVGFGWFSNVADNDVTWTASSAGGGLAPVSFLNGNNKGKTVTVVGSSIGQATLQVDVAGHSGLPPTVTTNVLGNNTVKAFVYVVRNTNGSNAATTQSQITSWLNRANQIYRQAAIEFVQQGGITYIDNTNYQNLTATDNWANLRALTATHSNTGGVELYFVTNIEGNVAGGNWPANNAEGGLVINCGKAIEKTLAHELGHASGLEDIYIEQIVSGIVTASLPIDKVQYAWLPSDWNNGVGPAYYPNGLQHRTLVSQRLLMYGTADGNGFNDGAIVIPRGQVYGLPRSGPARLLNVGLSSLNRDPRHW